MVCPSPGLPLCPSPGGCVVDIRDELARFVARPRPGHYELTEDGIAAGGGIPDTVVQ